MKYSVMISGMIFGIGTFSWLLADLLVARNATPMEASYWAVLKASAIIGSTVCLLGVDQLLIREKGIETTLSYRALLQVTIIGLIFSICLTYLSIVSSFLELFVAVISLSLSTYVCSFFRSHGQYVSAQLMQNGWKPIFLIVLLTIFVVASGRIVYLGYAILVSTLLISISIIFAWNKLKWEIPHFQARIFPSKLDQYKVGFMFFVSVLSLNLSLYLEQLLLAREGYFYASSLYFAHASAFLPFAIGVNGFIGFFAGPIIRNNSHLVSKRIYIVCFSIIICAFLMCGLSFYFGKYIFSIFLSSNYRFDIWLALGILAIGFLRTLYLLPSSYIGFVSPVRDLQIFIFINVFGILVFVLSFYLLIHFDLSPEYSIAISSLANWAVKVVGGLTICVTGASTLCNSN